MVTVPGQSDLCSKERELDKGCGQSRLLAGSVPKRAAAQPGPLHGQEDMQPPPATGALPWWTCPL